MISLRDQIAIVGIGETDFGIKLNRGVREMTTEAVYKALDDAKITPKDIDGLITGELWLDKFIRKGEMANAMGLSNLRYTSALGTTGTGNISTFSRAAMAIATGQCETVLSYWCNNYSSFYAKWLKSASGERRIDLTVGVKDTFEVPYGSNGPRIYFPQVAMRYMYEFGLSKDQFSRQLGAICINHRRNAVLNGKGVEKEPLTYEGYLNSPMVADPLRLPDFCRWHDGACAWIMTSAERAKDFPNRPVYVTGLGYGCVPEARGDYWIQGGKNYVHKPHMAVAADRALQMAGITRKDLDLAMIYDAFSIMFLIFFESLGFCKYGEGGALAESGAISLEGSIPVNTHGGHLSHSYLNMASHYCEAVRQLRGTAGPTQIKNAELALVECGDSWEEYVAILRKG